jgi:nitrite reductase/ring-hydroxylating ferredoxin subunit
MDFLGDSQKNLESEATSSARRFGIYLVCDSADLPEGGRLHTQVDNRFVTLFRINGKLSAIDAVCHHAGGPLTLGNLADIEDLGDMVVVKCPWHRFSVCISTGVKAYQAVSVIDGKPVNKGWVTGSIVQRAFPVFEEDGKVYLRYFVEGSCASDKDSTNGLCMKPYELFTNPACFVRPLDVN